VEREGGADGQDRSVESTGMATSDCRGEHHTDVTDWPPRGGRTPRRQETVDRLPQVVL
jgi:hypothetical protein